MHDRTAAELAEEALRLADSAAGRAAPVAAAAAQRAAAEGNDRARSIALRAWGRGVRESGNMALAVRYLRDSVRFAVRAGAPELAAESRITLAVVLAERGRPRQAIREIDRAVAESSGAARARARAQRADILHQIGRREQALVEYQVAVPMLRRAGDLLNLQRTLVNRGILQTERHAFTAAEKDLTEAHGLAGRLDRRLAIGIIAENLGYLETLRGDVPAALVHLDRAERIITANGGELGTLYRDRSELLLSVGATAEAVDAAQRAVAAHAQRGRGLDVPDARLILAQAAFLAGELRTAREQANRAQREFTRQHQTEWAALARLIVLRTDLAANGRTRMPTETLHEIVKTLTASWPESALEARLAASQALHSRSRPVAAKAMLEVATAARRRGPAALRARAWYAQALLRQQAGDRAGAAQAVRAGLRILDEHATSLGASDLRAYSAVHRMDLVELGLRAAMRDGRARTVFAWAERSRASRLLNPPMLPPDDPVLAELLSELRTAARVGGHASRRVALERQVRDHVRMHRASTAGRAPGPAPVSEVAAALGDQALVEFVQLDGRLHGLCLVDGRLVLHGLGPTEAAADLIDRLQFALHGLTRTGRAAPSARLLIDAAAQLDRLLFGPFGQVTRRALVVVPTGALHSVPWSVLPSLSGRAVTVSPSATLWHAANTRRPECGGVAVVAGPGLAGADAEAHAVAGIHSVPSITGTDATVASVLDALGSHDLVHLAAHGQLAPNNPQFSSLRLQDGPMVVYDLHRQRRMPHTVVLAACDSARSVVCTGDELLGLSAAFIARGTAQLVASVVPIPDVETAPLMTALHRRLAAGDRPAAALAATQLELREGGPRQLAAAAGFVCLGG